MVAKLLQEYSQRQRYLGVGTFIRSAGGLPRNLLVILKDIFHAEEFNGEVPFQEKPISERSQRSAVQRASAWFYRDARAMGEAGLAAERGVNRAADSNAGAALRGQAAGGITFELLTGLRRPRDTPEISRCVLLRPGPFCWKIKPDEWDKNTGAIWSKFQLNPMLCPRWHLLICCCGTLLPEIPSRPRPWTSRQRPTTL